MIVVAIVAILASGGLPGLTSQVRKSRRADAETVLLQAEQYLQRYYATSSSGYTGADLPSPGLTASPVGSGSRSTTTSRWRFRRRAELQAQRHAHPDR
jgi:type IV pilus assembly protein PilE